MRVVNKFLRKGLTPFLKSEDGLVTVEWISLVAAVVVGGIAIVWAVMDQAGGVSSGIAASISAANSAGCSAATNISTC
jgi:hypothetical protein